MDKVYIVASGADHVINEVFDNREDAEKYVCFHRKTAIMICVYKNIRFIKTQN